MNKLGKSHAFKSGFVAGFTAPFRVFTRSQVFISHSKYDTVGMAWRQVGGYLNEATKIEELNFGKATSKQKRESALH